MCIRDRPITVVSTVKIKGQSSVGEVLGINGKNAIVMFGMIKTNVKLDKLERSTPIPVSYTHLISMVIKHITTTLKDDQTSEQYKYYFLHK